MNSDEKNSVSLSIRIYRSFLRASLSLYLLILKISSNRKKTSNKKCDLKILITGTFYSDQWLITHLQPLANASDVKLVTMVAVTNVPKIDGVKAIYPPAWLIRICGKVPSRLITFAFYAIRTRPDIIGGFHLLLNGLLSILLAKITGARSLYICGGGPREVEGGGFKTENRIFNKIKYADYEIEKKLLEAIGYCDLVITMGTSAIKYFTEKGIRTNFEIIAGGFSRNEYYKASNKKEFDLILIGRLSPVKQVDLFLRSISIASKKLKNINSIIVGDGPDRVFLEKLSNELGLERSVTFVGWQDNVGDWLRKSKIIMLTSSSEGLSQALIQAMMCGLPAIVSNVGDLSDIVTDGYNGYLIDELNEFEFSKKIITLLENDKLLESFSNNAFKESMRFEIDKVTNKWDVLLRSLISDVQKNEKYKT